MANRKARKSMTKAPRNSRPIETSALLKLLAMARNDMSAGRVQPLDGLKERIRARSETSQAIT
ncbi:hypothetical protein B2G71_11990 [Novosphingobium sp. PC22D]|nr:hypothetical protein B2G71_11990 [Novosphingobium sp. PC22D]